MCKSMKYVHNFCVAGAFLWWPTLAKMKLHDIPNAESLSNCKFSQKTLEFKYL